jgi:hypothetical protein
MLQVSYVSQSSEPMSSEQLLALLLQCRKNNTANAVTGMLLYKNGTFLQVIEGEDAVIDELVAQILIDPRHAQVQLLSRKPIASRQYADWSMGFEQVTDARLEGVEGLKDFSASNFNFDYLASNESVVAQLMDHFREPHYDELIGEIYAKDKVIDHLRSALAQLRGQAQIARLALESLSEATRKGQPTEALLPMCDSALESMRSH